MMASNDSIPLQELCCHCCCSFECLSLGSFLLYSLTPVYTQWARGVCLLTCLTSSERALPCHMAPYWSFCNRILPHRYLAQVNSIVGTQGKPCVQSVGSVSPPHRTHMPWSVDLGTCAPILILVLEASHAESISHTHVSSNNHIFCTA